jgi:hypothetical protein
LESCDTDPAVSFPMVVASDDVRGHTGTFPTAHLSVHASTPD